MLDLIPVVGGTLTVVVDVVDEQFKEYIAKRMEDRISNTINSFYHKEIESQTEYVCISFLYTYEMAIKERIMAKRNSQEE